MMSFFFSAAPERTASVFSSIRDFAKLLITLRVWRKRVWSLVGMYCTNLRIGMGIQCQNERNSSVKLDGNGIASALCPVCQICTRCRPNVN